MKTKYFSVVFTSVLALGLIASINPSVRANPALSQKNIAKTGFSITTEKPQAYNPPNRGYPERREGAGSY
ncbi:hypothetical protein [Coleofasciculus sp. FACHB-1120]|uniref:hypothetical protein n=1 Tax=Coleofasciculus sp. FACHB-1120 TaxID=2692783 RepID=UPI00168640FC|nr:hypothetical protein [Coleofasciculus sp. FACHB-1120]MBD2744525.1 hypothetical protein [Coleofasciculus sp. FACHB-1120]